MQTTKHTRNVQTGRPHPGTHLPMTEVGVLSELGVRKEERIRNEMRVRDGSQIGSVCYGK